MKKQKIISAGHVCLDITPEFNERKQKAIHELFLPGQLISMGKADEVLADLFPIQGLQ